MAQFQVLHRQLSRARERRGSTAQAQPDPRRRRTGTRLATPTTPAPDPPKSRPRPAHSPAQDIKPAPGGRVVRTSLASPHRRDPGTSSENAGANFLGPCSCADLGTSPENAGATSSASTTGDR